MNTCFRGIICFCLAGCLGLCLSVQAGDLQRDIQNYKLSQSHYLKAKQAFSDNKYELMRRELEKCIAQFAGHDGAHYLMAQLLYQEGIYPQANEHILTAKSCFHDMVELRAVARTELHDRLRTRRHALEEKMALYQAEMARAGSADSVALSGVISKIRNEISDIDRQLQETFTEPKELPAGYCFVHGNILLKQGDVAGAHDQYMETIRLEPTRVEAYNNLAHIYYTKGNYKVALAILQRALASHLTVNPEFLAEVKNKAGGQLE